MNSQEDINVDYEQLKAIVGEIRKCSYDLATSKKKADEAWSRCSQSMSENMSKGMQYHKEETDAEFNKAIENLNNYANSLDSISNIWNETETQIMSASKEFEERLSKVQKEVNFFFGKNKIEQNDSSNI